MYPLKAREIRGTYATLLLPIDQNDAIDFARLRDQLDYLMESGVDGVYTNGSAGEFYTLSEREFDAIGVLLAEKCEKAQLPFQIGATSTSAQTSLERVRRAAGLKPGAIQVILPDWYPVTISEAVDFLSKVADAAHPIPLVLYNPPHAKQVLSVEQLETLCDAVPAIAGIKVAGGNDEWYGQAQSLTGRISVFVPGHQLATGVLHGAAGSYSNVACLQPRGAKFWNTLMQTQPAVALEYEKAIQSFLRMHILPFRDRHGYSNMALDKLLACVGDWAPLTPRLRWPYRSVPQSDAVPLQRAARTSLPFLFDAVLHQQMKQEVSTN